ncbi:MAG: hypothetical protein NUW01_07130 [Gemmatimonadaceae bacterium]|nr:hypothetical protein [Gemmatimonadaceae bacterium]
MAKALAPTHVLRVILSTGGPMRMYFFDRAKDALAAFESVWNAVESSSLSENGNGDLIRTLRLDCLDGMQSLIHINGVSIAEVATLKAFKQFAGWLADWDAGKKVPAVCRDLQVLRVFLTTGQPGIREYFFGSRQQREKEYDGITSALKGILRQKSSPTPGRSGMGLANAVRFDSLGGTKALINLNALAAVEGASLKEIKRQGEWLASCERAG